MRFSVYDNFKGFVSSRPPLMVFMICLGFFAVILLSLDYYVKKHNITNPDISRDWNVFLGNFGDLEFCIQNTTVEDMSVSAPTTLPTTTGTNKPHAGPTTLQSTDYDNYRNYSVQMLVSVNPTHDFGSMPHNATQLSLSAVVQGEHLGLADHLSQEEINVTVELPYNTTQCSNINNCDVVKVVTCVHFSAPSDIFPSSRSPDTCQVVNETGIEWHGHMKAHKPKDAMHPLSPYFCKALPTIQVHHTFKSTLSVYLTIHDKSVINRHLMHTSYFLFVMVITLFCYALIRGKPHHAKYAAANTTDKGLTSPV